jgi:hypothetical protein
MWVRKLQAAEMSHWINNHLIQLCNLKLIFKIINDIGNKHWNSLSWELKQLWFQNWCSLVCVQDVTSLIKDFNCAAMTCRWSVATVSGRKQVWILILVWTTVTLNSGASSEIWKTSYIKCSLFIKFKFTKYGNLVHCLCCAWAGSRENIHLMWNITKY